MIPQGTSLTNAAFFAAQVAAIDGAATCAQLSAADADAVASLEAEIATVTAVLAQLAPLVVVPTNIGEVITWITSTIAPIAISQANYTAQLAALTSSLSALNAAIAARKATLGCV
jgi:hypothetical protein